MDPLSITAATITIIQTISSTYNAIQSLKGLPKAFKEVGQELPLVEETLELVRCHLQTPNIDESAQKAIEPIIKSCQEKTNALNEIFKEIDKRKKNDKEAKDWADFVSSYRTAMLRMGKAHRVEVLMKGILDGLRGLATHQLFTLATKAQVDKLEDAIKKLSKVEPSLPDSDFESNSPSFTQNVSADGDGKMFNSVGGPQNINFGTEFKANGDQHFGMDFMKYLKEDPGR
jgi:hypothetical protein